MKPSRLGILLIAVLLLSIAVSACGDEEGDTTTDETTTTATTGTGTTAATGTGTTEEPETGGTSVEGVWNLITEDGSPPSALGYNSIVLTLEDGTFSSVFDGSAGVCTWSGTYTATESELTMTAEVATGPPCDMAIGQTRTAQMNMSVDGNTLTLDWTAQPMLTLQVYERVS